MILYRGDTEHEDLLRNGLIPVPFPWDETFECKARLQAYQSLVDAGLTSNAQRTPVKVPSDGKEVNFEPFCEREECNKSIFSKGSAVYINRSIRAFGRIVTVI